MSSSAGADTVPDSQVLCKRVSIPNIRDIAEAMPGEIRYGRIVRCANPGHASPDDVRLLLEDLGLKELIDLRSSEELEEDHTALLFTQATFQRYTRSWWSRTAAKEVSPSGKAAAPGEMYSSGPPVTKDSRGSEIKLLTRTQISLLERSRFYKGLVYKLHPSVTMPAIVLSQIKKEWSRDILLPHVNEGGLFLLNEILIDSAQPEIGRVLEHVLAAVEADRPVLFFCKAGKDRTGLIAMMLLACLGASDEQIVADYARSGQYHMMALAGIEKRSELAGLDKKVFEASPPEVCLHALSYTRKKYGSVQQYMERTGFGVTQQARLRELMRIRGSAARLVEDGRQLALTKTVPL